VWGDLNKTSNGGKSSSSTTNSFKGVVLKLTSSLISQVCPVVANWDNGLVSGGFSITSRKVPIVYQHESVTSGWIYKRATQVQVIKIENVYDFQWDLIYSNLEDNPHLIVFSSDVIYGGGYKKEVHNKEDNAFVRWMKNVMTNNDGLTGVIPHNFPVVDLVAYSNRDLETSVKIKVKNKLSKRFGDYIFDTGINFSHIQEWTFESQPPDSICWVFITSGKELTKEERQQAVERFGGHFALSSHVQQDYFTEEIDLGVIQDEVIK